MYHICTLHRDAVIVLEFLHYILSYCARRSFSLKAAIRLVSGSPESRSGGSKEEGEESVDEEAEERAV